MSNYPLINVTTQQNADKTMDKLLQVHKFFDEFQ